MLLYKGILIKKFCRKEGKDMRKVLKMFVTVLCILVTTASILPTEVIAAGSSKSEVTCKENTIECTKSKFLDCTFYLNSCTDTVAEFLEWSKGDPAYKLEICVVDSDMTFADLKEGTYKSGQKNPVLSVTYYKWYWYVDAPTTGIWRKERNTASYTINILNADTKEKHFQGTIEAKFGSYSQSGLFLGIELSNGQFDFTVGETYTEQSEEAEVQESSAASNTNKSSANNGSTNSSNSTQKKNLSGNCSYCGGLGTCHVCVNGECDKCFGDQYLDCPSCFSGRCSSCGGYGEIDRYSGGRIVTKTCSRCGGDGDCNKCNGYGEIKCSRCKGSGNCVSCGGTTVCRYCKGKNAFLD